MDIEKLSGILESLYISTGLSNAIVDLKGNILHSVGWKSICMDFHRKQKISSARCMESDTILASQLMKKEKNAIYTCKNGLVDAATPIIIDNKHIANMFIGQFFTEKPDLNYFIKQAEELGFDKEKYLKALEECQVYTRETIVTYLELLSDLINIASESAKKTIQLKTQNGEKADRASELLVANKELAYQNNEKEKRAAELLIANTELTFQNKEKEKRAVALDIANKELALQNNRISYLSYHDFLTGLYNRTYFEEEKVRLDTPRQLPISIIMGDINGLRLINDGFGHAKGDELLVEISEILKSCGREEDIVARIGGDEFGILLPRTDSHAAHLICSRIYDTCNGFSFNGNLIYPSISLGHATKTTKEEAMDDILIAAEESMSKQKLLESRSAHSSIIASIKVIMFEKSQETEEHAERLIQLSKSIGIAMCLTDDQLNELELLSTLHDIGKMSIPAAILSKTGKLSAEEWREMKKHPEVGFRIAQATSELVPIAKYILCHHERWDGTGYPQGLVGEDIPLLSRILTVVDSFDAMTNDRSYREAMSRAEAIEEIRKGTGTQFDPVISRLFLSLQS